MNQLLIGNRVGKLTVWGRVPKELRHTKNSELYCICDCGGFSQVLQYNLKSGNSKTCGCGQLEASKANGKLRKKHGHWREIRPGVWRSTPTYKSWEAMKRRCLNPNDPAYKNYGGRGITICEKWNSFENFLADMGERPKWATGGIDRIDNDGNYEPKNCRWATILQQNRNKRSVREEIRML